MRHVLGHIGLDYARRGSGQPQPRRNRDDPSLCDSSCSASSVPTLKERGIVHAPPALSLKPRVCERVRIEIMGIAYAIQRGIG